METQGALFFFVASAQGIFFSLVQFFSHNKTRGHQLILATIIFCFSIALIESALWMSGKMDDYIHFTSVSVPLPFLYGPLTYFYFRKIFGPPVSTRSYLLHFMPFLICFIYCAQYYFHTSASKMEMMNDLRNYQDFFYVYISSKFIFYTQAISLVAYCIFIFKNFKSKASTTGDVRKWFLLTIGIPAIYTLNFVLFHLLAYFQLIGGCSDYGISFSTAGFIYLFSWLAIARPKVFDGYGIGEALTSPIKKYMNSVLTEKASQELFANLDALMENEKLYTDPGINLESLAEKLHTTRNSLSQVINEHSGMNFFDFINEYRINEAQKILTETTSNEKNIIEVAYEVGFNNKVSFNRYFKKITGTTPSEFRKNTKS